MTTVKFSSAEWKELVNAPHWIYGALTAAERGNILTRHSEAKALREFMSSYQTESPLVKEIIARQEDADEKLEGSLEDAEKALSDVGALLERKVDEAEGDAVRGFLVGAGQAVAEAAREGYRKVGVAISPKEQETLVRIEKDLRATEADRLRRHDAIVAADAEKREKEKREAEAREADKRKREEEKRQAEAEARAERERDEARKREQEAEAQRKTLAEEEAEAKAQREKVEAMRAASAQRTEEAKARAAQEREGEQKKALEEEEAKKKALAEAEAKKAAERTYKVKKGDTLSGIALMMYGDAGRWPDIFKANRDIIEKASLIRPGWVLRIPE